jgi:hypothetical protein
LPHSSIALSSTQLLSKNPRAMHQCPVGSQH